MADDDKKKKKKSGGGGDKKGHHEGLQLLFLGAVLIGVVAWMVSQHGHVDDGAQQALGGVRGGETLDRSKERPTTWVDVVETARQGHNAQQVEQQGGVHR